MMRNRKININKFIMRGKKNNFSLYFLLTSPSTFLVHIAYANEVKNMVLMAA
jgi:hypothetical protein